MYVRVAELGIIVPLPASIPSLLSVDVSSGNKYSYIK